MAASDPNQPPSDASRAPSAANASAWPSWPTPPLLSGPMNDLVGLAVITGLLATLVQSLMSHMSNQSVSHMNNIGANAQVANAGLATMARAVDQILGPPQTAAAAPAAAARPMLGATGPVSPQGSGGCHITQTMAELAPLQVT